MNEFEKIYNKTIDKWIKDGDRTTLDDYEKKLIKETIRSGVDPNRIEAMRKNAKNVWNSEGLSMNEIYSIIAKMYEGLSTARK